MSGIPYSFSCDVISVIVALTLDLQLGLRQMESMEITILNALPKHKHYDLYKIYCSQNVIIYPLKSDNNKNEYNANNRYNNNTVMERRICVL